MTTDQKVEGSNPSGRATIYRRFLRFFFTLLSAIRCRIFRFFYQKNAIFDAFLHKMCTKFTQNAQRISAGYRRFKKSYLHKK